MRKITLSISVSLDGCFEGPDREIDWHLVDAELHQHMNDWLKTQSVFIDGRITFELMAGFWPTADQDPDAGPQIAEFAGIWRDMPKIVYSRTLQKADWNTTILREVVPEEVARLKEQPGGDMVVGGPDLAATFRRLGLIDEYRIYVHPVLLGRGRPLFRPQDETVSLRLVETKTFGNGVVMLRYLSR